MKYQDYYFIKNVGIYTKSLRRVNFVYPNQIEFWFDYHITRLTYKWDMNAYIEFFRIGKELNLREKENIDYIK